MADNNEEQTELEEFYRDEFDDLIMNDYWESNIDTEDIPIFSFGDLIKAYNDMYGPQSVTLADGSEHFYKLKPIFDDQNKQVTKSLEAVEVSEDGSTRKAIPLNLEAEVESWRHAFEQDLERDYAIEDYADQISDYLAKNVPEMIDKQLSDSINISAQQCIEDIPIDATAITPPYRAEGKSSTTVSSPTVSVLTEYPEGEPGIIFSDTSLTSDYVKNKIEERIAENLYLNYDINQKTAWELHYNTSRAEMLHAETMDELRDCINEEIKHHTKEKTMPKDLQDILNELNGRIKDQDGLAVQFECREAEASEPYDEREIFLEQDDPYAVFDINLGMSSEVDEWQSQIDAVYQEQQKEEHQNARENRGDEIR